MVPVTDLGQFLAARLIISIGAARVNIPAADAQVITGVT